MILRDMGPYSQCQRCEHKVPIASMIWDNGYLVCGKNQPGTYCSEDGKLLGSVELRQAREVGINKHEYEPEKKLVNPTDPAIQIEQLPASAGTY